jgi:diguanylate cyclase (GGDEF)-like protein
MLARDQRRKTWKTIAGWSAGTTFGSVLLSLAATAAVMRVLWGIDPAHSFTVPEIWVGGLLIGAVVPLVVVPIVSWRLLVTMDTLQQTRAALARAAHTDMLTGLLNRHGFTAAVDAALTSARKARTPVGLILADIDHFKSVNDRHGHAVGDRAIAHVGCILASVAQDAGAIVTRHGGEEFALLAAGRGVRDLHALAETARARVAATPLALGNLELPLSISAGFALDTHDAARLDDLLSRADAALYRAKAAGRNRVACAAA